MRLPEDFWENIRHLIPDDLDASGARIAREVVRHFGGPRDVELARAFLAANLPAGRLYVYGAGSHSEALHSTLMGMEGVDLLGYLDRDAARLGDFHGKEIIPPEEIIGRDYDRVLISYEHMESKLVDRLIALGVPEDKIFPIYSNMDYIGMATAAYLKAIQRRLKNMRFKYVIVRSRVHEIIADDVLTHILPPDETLVIHIGPRHKAHVDDRHFWTIDVRQCVNLAAALLQSINPRAIFLSTEQEFDLAYFVIRDALPDTPLIHEIYDFFPIIPDDWIARGIDASPRVIELMRLSNLHSVQRSQMVVSKRSGPDWDSALKTFKAPYHYVFPGLDFAADGRDVDVNPPHLAPPAGSVRLLYAGVMVPSNFGIYKRSDYNFLPLMEEMAETPGVKIDIYNSSHGDRGQDHIYKDYIEKYASSNIRYNLRIPYKSLLSIMPNYHYGWLCLPTRERDLCDQLIVICNRFTAYILGGLPIIVDAEWRHIADLVESFDAGLVIDDVTPENVLAQIAGADNQAKRRGARRLLAHMRDHNRSVFAAVREFITGAELLHT